ncbi:hypothetical protein [Dyella sp.]|uniref:hypothetical protein n=1 Tax=Dyella sp. TaxID=1869338 RepID=UPI00283D0033|nr:hypothetical protein [Dyella sp.]MDR3446155.1 hypothetical protein [Dyella sp.]
MELTNAYPLPLALAPLLPSVRCCPTASILLVGTRSDLTDRLRLTSEDGSKQAKEWNATHLTISAKTGQNCDGMLTFLLALMKKTQT